MNSSTICTARSCIRILSGLDTPPGMTSASNSSVSTSLSTRSGVIVSAFSPPFSPWIGSVLIDASVTLAPASISAWRGLNNSSFSNPSVAIISTRASFRSGNVNLLRSRAHNSSRRQSVPERSGEPRISNDARNGVPMTRITYCDDSQPGITRKKVRHGWGYWDAEGKRITDRDEIDRLNAIGMPPAYRDCWFCPDPDGHIQATGYDDKGRKQYRYHTGFREAQEAAKYDRCSVFGEHLPKLRAKV